MQTNRTVTGVIWSAVERFSTMGIQFILNIIIARILSPSDFGVIGMLTVFLAICQCLIDGGFSSALIQSKNRTEKDYGTVFIFNFIISIFLYCILFASAPLIANFYHSSILIPVLRVVGLNIIVTSLSNVQKAILTISVDFRTQSIVSVASSIISGCAGILFAYLGYGVWALVIQTMTNGALHSIFYWLLSKVRFSIVFDKNSLKKLGGFGIKLMFANLLNTVYENLYALFIGRRYSSQDLGYYARADQFGVISAQTLSTIIGRVAFPVFSKKQDDKNELSLLYTKFIKTSTFLIFPIMIFLAGLSNQVVSVLLTEKWLPIVPLLVVLAFEGLYSPINKINLMLLQAVGRSDLFLRLEVLKKVLATIILLLTIRYGILWVCVGRLIYGGVATMINMYFTVTIINKSYWQQIKDWLPNFIMALIVGVGVYILGNTIDNIYTSLSLSLMCGMLLYALLSRFLNRDVFFMVLSTIRGYKSINNNSK